MHFNLPQITEFVILFVAWMLIATRCLMTSMR